MTNPVLIQNSIHADLRIDTSLQGSACKDLRNTTVVLQEFKQAALEYPVVLTKNPHTGAFSAVALFGFDEGENLYVGDNGQWDALYVPLNVLRGPFMLGTQQVSGDGLEHVLLVDLDDVRVSREYGEFLFNDRGFPTPYLEKMTSVIKSLKDGLDQTSAFIDVLLQFNLIAPAQLKIEFVNGEHREVRGLYTINPDAVRELSASEIQRLHAENYLEYIYAMMISFGQIRCLIELRNRKLRRANL